MFERTTKQINNVQLKWCFLDKVNNKGQYPSGKYEVVLSMDQKQAEEFNLIPHGNKQTLKKMEDGRFEIKLKSRNPILVVDKEQIKMTEEQMSKIGNGTVATVKLHNYETKFGIFVGVLAIKVNKLVEYNGNTTSFEDDGFAAIMADNNGEMPF